MKIHMHAINVILNTYGVVDKMNAAALDLGLPKVFFVTTDKPGVYKILNSEYRIVTRFRFGFPPVLFELIYHPGRLDEVNLGFFLPK